MDDDRNACDPAPTAAMACTPAFFPHTFSYGRFRCSPFLLCTTNVGTRGQNAGGTVDEDRTTTVGVDLHSHGLRNGTKCKIYDVAGQGVVTVARLLSGALRVFCCCAVGARYYVPRDEKRLSGFEHLGGVGDSVRVSLGISRHMTTVAAKQAFDGMRCNCRPFARR